MLRSFPNTSVSLKQENIRQHQYKRKQKTTPDLKFAPNKVKILNVLGTLSPQSWPLDSFWSVVKRKSSYFGMKLNNHSSLWFKMAEPENRAEPGGRLQTSHLPRWSDLKINIIYRRTSGPRAKNKTSDSWFSTHNSDFKFRLFFFDFCYQNVDFWH